MIYGFWILCKDNLCTYKDIFFPWKYLFSLAFGYLIPLEFVFKNLHD